MIKTIHNTENAKMIQYTDGTFKVIYKKFFNDDIFGMEFANTLDAEEMFNFVNRAGITPEELENLGFEI